MSTLHALCEGYDSFIEKVFPSHKEHFESLTYSQNPDVVFITCSDSRINPHLFTSCKPGELFILRSAGNIMPGAGSVSKGEQASLEFAITALNTPHVVVCGHSDCGAIKAIRDNPDLSSSFALKDWLQECGCVTKIQAEKDKPLEELVKMNVEQQLKNMRSLPFIQERLESGAVTLHGWYYDIGNGKVDAYDSANKAWCSLKDLVRGTPRSS